MLDFDDSDFNKAKKWTIVASSIYFLIGNDIVDRATIFSAMHFNNIKLSSNSITIDLFIYAVVIYFLFRLSLFNFRHKEAILHTDAIKKIISLLENIEGGVLSLIEMSKSAGEQYVSSQKEMREAINILSSSVSNFKKDTIAVSFGIDVIDIENTILSDPLMFEVIDSYASPECKNVYEQWSNNLISLKLFISQIFIPHRNMKMYAEFPNDAIRPFLPPYENTTSVVTSAAERFYNEYARVSTEISDLLNKIKNSLSDLNKLGDVAKTEKFARSGIYYSDILVPILFAAVATITFLYRVYIWICCI